MKDDERQLLDRLRAMPRVRPFPFAFATDLAKSLGMNEKRATYILDKWADKGWWEYGVSLRTGWLTDKGREQS